MEGPSVSSGPKHLPYGDTLHYPGCGCPHQWTLGTRAADLVDLLAEVSFSQWMHRCWTYCEVVFRSHDHSASPSEAGDADLQRACHNFQEKRLLPTRPLRICYMLPHHNTTGAAELCFVAREVQILLDATMLLVCYRWHEVLGGAPPTAEAERCGLGFIPPAFCSSVQLFTVSAHGRAHHHRGAQVGHRCHGHAALDRRAGGRRPGLPPAPAAERCVPR